MTFPEKEKLDYQSKLDLRRILMEKVFLGITILVIGWFGSVAIEKYKSNETQQRFYLEKRYEGIKKIRGAFSQVTNSFFAASEDVCENKVLSSEQRIRIRENITALIVALNDSAPILSESYNESANLVVNIFYGMVADSYSLTCDHRNFANAVAGHFTNVNKIELDSKLLFTASDESKIHVPTRETRKRIDEMGVEIYVSENFEKFTQSLGSK